MNMPFTLGNLQVRTPNPGWILGDLGAFRVTIIATHHMFCLLGYVWKKQAVPAGYPKFFDLAKPSFNPYIPVSPEDVIEEIPEGN